MYAGRDFDPIDNNSGQIYGFDLSQTLPAGSDLVGAVSGIILESGDDDIPAAHLVGIPEVSGSRITQAIFWGEPPRTFAGNKYVFFAAVRTSVGEVIIPWARISLEASFGQSTFRSTPSPLAANVFVIPMPGPYFVIPTLGGYALQDLPPVDQGESRLCGFDFASLLSPGEAINDANLSLTVIAGSDKTIDENHQAYFSVPAIVSPSQVQQLISIPPNPALIAKPPQFRDLRGVSYAFAVTAKTSFGQAIATWSRLRIRSFYA